mgnify:CR=1 FL=1
MENKSFSKMVKDELLIKKVKKQDNNLLKNLFIKSGSMNDPNNKYHFEIAFTELKDAEESQIVLQNNNIKSKITKKKNKYVLYIKEGEEISKALAFMGANNAVIKFEEIRVKRDMNNKINRIVNCESANLNKTINASIEQIEAIKKLKKLKKFEKLDSSLKEIANLRLAYPNATLIELGQKLEKPIGKSGVNYRMKKIIDLAR